MNRRSFITGIIAASVAPLLLLHDDKPRWKKSLGGVWEPNMGNTIRWVKNPEWKDAQYAFNLSIEELREINKMLMDMTYGWVKPGYELPLLKRYALIA